MSSGRNVQPKAADKRIRRCKHPPPSMSLGDLVDLVGIEPNPGIDNT